MSSRQQPPTPPAGQPELHSFKPGERTFLGRYGILVLLGFLTILGAYGCFAYSQYTSGYERAIEYGIQGIGGKGGGSWEFWFQLGYGRGKAEAKAGPPLWKDKK